jgi:hypothetical protein
VDVSVVFPGLAVKSARRLEQRRDLAGGVDVGPLRLRRLELAASASRGARRDVPVLHGEIQNLTEPHERLIDALVRQRSTLDLLASCTSRFELVALVDLRGPIAINLGDRDVRQSVVLEERQQVVGELPPVELGGRLPQLGLDHRDSTLSVKHLERLGSSRA